MHALVSLSLAAALAVAGTRVTPINGGNALTLPAHRHVLRIDPGDAGPAI
ncbi:MAG: hypothetical protein ACK4N5_23565 [Myxococcales bacterium]